MKIFLILSFFVGMFILSFGVLSFAENQNDDGSSEKFFRVGDEFYKWQNLHTGETISIEGIFTAIIIEGLGPILIVTFIVIYAIKKKRRSSK